MFLKVAINKKVFYSTELTNECLREKLAETDYSGAAGDVKFEGRHYSARDSRVVQYKDGKWVPIS